MRKGLIIVLGIAFVLSLTGVVSAADPLAEDMFDTSHIFPGDGGKEIDDDYVSAYVPVTFDISSEQYTVTIPSKIAFSPTVRRVETYAEITDATLIQGSSLNLTVKSNKGWKLEHLENSGVFVEYEVTATDSDTEAIIAHITSSSPAIVDILQLSNVHSKKTKLVFELTGDPTFTGGYADTLTFTAKITRGSS